MKHFLFICIYFIISSFILFAQQIEKDKIVVIGSASIEVPADRVMLKLTITFEDRIDGQKAYTQHKEQELKLLNFLKELNIPDSLVTYSLLNISTRFEYPSSQQIKIFQTSQTVSIILTDLSKLPSFQLSLISNGYTSFEGSFESSKSPGAVKEALSKAVQQAKIKAEIMANAAGRKIKKVSKISDTDEIEPRIASYRNYIYSRNISYSRTTIQLINIPQTVTIDKQVRVIFDLVD
ncbi:MAG: hypothetical protein AUK34_07505 [Ignavibacteria bacterium CG2_30_36_16]|nr:SIMPL domain-containing protein [Ignavibacteria bacterium]OIP59691.1 MAG: hypothetical protein AUK34_07505 [Ignavibacteria bacterium CG2_30_36_16]PJB00300.1 MAG: hypothetical protein CO127_08735 [Ignavibacteria bacterium CG_4_9_14_3_um_filter_36_18]